MYRYILKAEEKAEETAGEKYPLDPTQSLKVGEVFQLAEETPLMPELEPVDPIAAVSNILRLPVGAYIKVFKIKHKRKGGPPWYQVKAIDRQKKPLGGGWINGVALRGQAQAKAQEQMRLQGALQNELSSKFKGQICERYKLTKEQLSTIAVEGFQKGWMIPTEEE